jgi:hypothetical protein
MNTSKHLTSSEIREVANRHNLRVAVSEDYITVYAKDTNIGVRAMDVQEPSAYNKWFNHNYGRAVENCPIACQSFIEELKSI